MPCSVRFSSLVSIPPSFTFGSLSTNCSNINGLGGKRDFVLECEQDSPPQNTYRMINCLNVDFPISQWVRKDIYLKQQ